MIPYSMVLILGLIAGFSLTIVLFITVVPKKKDGKLNNRFLQWLHDFFHFKKLYLESILRFFFALSTLVCICIGFFMMLGYRYVYEYDYYVGRPVSSREPTVGIGLVLMVLGPIVIRLLYEASMMLILLVKNTIEINNKLSGHPGKTDSVPAFTANPEAVPVSAGNSEPVAEQPKADTQDLNCPVCGSSVTEASSFCRICGHKLK